MMGISSPVVAGNFIVSSIRVVGRTCISRLNGVIVRSSHRGSMHICVANRQGVIGHLASDSVGTITSLRRTRSASASPMVVPVATAYSKVLPRGVRISPRGLDIRLRGGIAGRFTVGIADSSDGPTRKLRITSLATGPRGIHVAKPRSLINGVSDIDISMDSGLRKVSRSAAVANTRLAVASGGRSALSSGSVDCLGFSGGKGIGIATGL